MSVVGCGSIFIIPGATTMITSINYNIEFLDPGTSTVFM